MDFHLISLLERVSFRAEIKHRNIANQPKADTQHETETPALQSLVTKSTALYWLVAVSFKRSLTALGQMTRQPTRTEAGKVLLPVSCLNSAGWKYRKYTYIYNYRIIE